MENIIKLIVVDDHEIFRQGLVMVLNRVKDFDVIAEASNGREFLEVLDKYKDEVDIVLMDIRMPEMDGIEATKIAKEKYPELKIVAISMHADSEYLYNMIELDINGFLLKNVKKAELETALRLVLNGGVYYSKELMSEIIHLKKEKQEKQEIDKFSERELEVLQLVANGLSNQEIADKLYISKRTVEGHKVNMISKMGCKNLINLIVNSINMKLIEV